MAGTGPAMTVRAMVSSKGTTGRRCGTRNEGHYTLNRIRTYSAAIAIHRREPWVGELDKRRVAEELAAMSRRQRALKPISKIRRSRVG
jgi:hypothetical protein